MLFSLHKHYLELYITDNDLNVSESLYCFTTSISHGVEIISRGCGVWASLMLFFFFFFNFLISAAIFNFLLEMENVDYLENHYRGDRRISKQSLDPLGTIDSGYNACKIFSNFRSPSSILPKMLIILKTV